MLHRLWIGGKWREGSDRKAVVSPFSGQTVAEQVLASRADLEELAEEATRGFASFRRTSRYLRSRLLTEMSRGIESRRSELVENIIQEAGKPRQLAEIEVTRAAGTFQFAAEAARSFIGCQIPIDADPGARAFDFAYWEWEPRGPVLGIAPFNFPLNLVAQKVAPALAVGAVVAIKPPPQAPGAASILAQVFEKAAREVSDSREGVPLGVFQVFHASNEAAEAAVVDTRFKVLSFTGSDQVGWALRVKAGHKKVLLELGGAAPVLVHRDADVKRAAERCAYGSFAYAGQICISVQRIFVHESIEKEFERELIEQTSRLVLGDPANADTLIGPVIDQKAADRIEKWVAEAKQSGASSVTELKRKGTLLSPTILRKVSPEEKVFSEEVFGPVVVLNSYSELDAAIESANRSRFGLQAGIFSSDDKVIRRTARELEVGGVIVNEVPTFRADHMPYGGMKDSGVGREGVRYAMEEYCDRKTVVTWEG